MTRTRSLPAARRVVSLCPSLTELVFRLGAGDRLVGITRFCIHPADGVAGIESVGGTKDPDVARIRELGPDLVLLDREENRLADAEALAEAGLTCHSSLSLRVEEIPGQIRELAALLDVGAAGEHLATAIEAAVVELSSSASKHLRSFAYLIWRKPWMTVSCDTYVHDLLTLAGGRNVFADRTDRYPTVSAGEIGRAAPERILLSSEPFPFHEEHRDELARATGLPGERFLLVDGELLSWHGSRTLEGLRYAAELFART